MNYTIPIPKSPFIDERTGLISRDWYLFLVNLFKSAASGFTGATTQVLHGGGAGYAAVNLTADVTGVLPGVNGGTGVANTLKTLTLGGNVNFGGAFATTPASTVTFTFVGATNVTFPTTGTLLTLAGLGTIATQNADNVTITGGLIKVTTVTAVNVFITTVSASAVKIGASTRLDNQVSTGGQTATFVAANKPGSGATSPDQWIIINLDGTEHYVPAFL